MLVSWHTWAGQGKSMISRNPAHGASLLVACLWASATGCGAMHAGALCHNVPRQSIRFGLAPQRTTDDAAEIGSEAALQAGEAALVRVMLLSALDAFRAGDYAQAIDLLDRALAVEPDMTAIRSLKSNVESIQESQDRDRLSRSSTRTGGLQTPTVHGFHDPSRTEDGIPSSSDRWSPSARELQFMRKRMEWRMSLQFIRGDLNHLAQAITEAGHVAVVVDDELMLEGPMSMGIENVRLRDVLSAMELAMPITYSDNLDAITVTAANRMPLVSRCYPLPASGAMHDGSPHRTATLSRWAVSGRQAHSQAVSSESSDPCLQAVTTLLELLERSWPEGSDWTLDGRADALLVTTTPDIHRQVEETLAVLSLQHPSIAWSQGKFFARAGGLVIGGFIGDYEGQIEGNVPILGKIPVLGLPFRYTKAVTMSESLLLIAPSKAASVSDRRRTDDSISPAAENHQALQGQGFGGGSLGNGMSYRGDARSGASGGGVE